MIAKKFEFKPTLFALATDPINGDLEDMGWKNESGIEMGRGVNIVSSPLSLAAHTITATGFDLRGNQAGSAVTHINVVAQEPNPQIQSPTSIGNCSR